MAQLESNTQELREILNTVNALPTAGEGGIQYDMVINIYAPPNENGYSPNNIEDYQGTIEYGTVQDVIGKIDAGIPAHVGGWIAYYYAGIEYKQFMLSVTACKMTLTTQYGLDGSYYLVLKFAGRVSHYGDIGVAISPDHAFTFLD